MREQAVMTESKSSSLKETARTLIYAVAIALFVRTFAYEPFNIPSGSMKPTLLVGDYLFVSKFSYGYSRYSLPFSLPLFKGRLFGSLPKRGDVAVFKLPADNSTDYIKRIVGLPGDKMQMINGILHIINSPISLMHIHVVFAVACTAPMIDLEHGITPCSKELGIIVIGGQPLRCWSPVNEDNNRRQSR